MTCLIVADQKLISFDKFIKVLYNSSEKDKTKDKKPVLTESSITRLQIENINLAENFKIPELRFYNSTFLNDKEISSDKIDKMDNKGHNSNNIKMDEDFFLVSIEPHVIKNSNFTTKNDTNNKLEEEYKIETGEIYFDQNTTFINYNLTFYTPFLNCISLKPIIENNFLNKNFKYSNIVKENFDKPILYYNLDHCKNNLNISSVLYQKLNNQNHLLENLLEHHFNLTSQDKKNPVLFKNYLDKISIKFILSEKIQIPQSIFKNESPNKIKQILLSMIYAKTNPVEGVYLTNNYYTREKNKIISHYFTYIKNNKIYIEDYCIKLDKLSILADIKERINKIFKGIETIVAKTNIKQDLAYNLTNFVNIINIVKIELIEISSKIEYMKILNCKNYNIINTSYLDCNKKAQTIMDIIRKIIRKGNLNLSLIILN